MKNNLLIGLGNLIDHTVEVEEGLHSWNVAFDTLKNIAILRQKASDAGYNDIYYKCQSLESRIEAVIERGLKK